MQAKGEGVLAVAGIGRSRFEGGRKRTAAAMAESDGEETIGEEEGMPLE